MAIEISSVHVHRSRITLSLSSAWLFNTELEDVMREDLTDAWAECPEYKDILGKTSPFPEEFESRIPSDERVLCLLRGMWGHKVTHKKRLELATFVLTDKMVHMFGKNEVFGSRSQSQDAVPLGTVTSISSFARKTLTGENYVVELIRAGDSDNLQMTKDFAAHSEKFVTLTRDAISKSSKGSSTVVNGESPLDALKKLKDLLDLGVISEAEFEEKRIILMGKI